MKAAVGQQQRVLKDSETNLGKINTLKLRPVLPLERVSHVVLCLYSSFCLTRSKFINALIFGFSRTVPEISGALSFDR